MSRGEGPASCGARVAVTSSVCLMVLIVGFGVWQSVSLAVAPDLAQDRGQVVHRTQRVAHVDFERLEVLFLKLHGGGVVPARSRFLPPEHEVLQCFSKLAA